MKKYSKNSTNFGNKFLKKIFLKKKFYFTKYFLFLPCSVGKLFGVWHERDALQNTLKNIFSKKNKGFSLSQKCHFVFESLVHEKIFKKQHQFWEQILYFFLKKC